MNIHTSFDRLVSVGFLSLICLTIRLANGATRQKTDVIYMKNGDRITCEIKKLGSSEKIVGGFRFG